MKLLNIFKRRSFRTPSNRNGRKLTPRYYRSSQNTETASPFRRKVAPKQSRGTFVRRLRNYAFGFIAVLVLFYCLSVQPNTKLTISDTSYSDAQTYQTATEKALKAIRNRNKLTFDERGIANNLKRQFPEINNVTIKLPFIGHIPKIDLDIASPTFSLSSAGKLYIIGSNGVVINADNQQLASASLPSLIDQSDININPGTRIIGTETVSFINSLLAQCKFAKVNVASLTLPPDPHALELRAEGASYFVKFDLEEDPLIQAGQYLAAKNKFDSEGTQPSQYLDVRVSGKIYYK